MSGWKNWLNEPHVADMMTIGFHVVFFSSSAMAWVQNVPDVSISTTSAFVAAIVVNWLVRSGAVGSWNCCVDDLDVGALDEALEAARRSSCRSRC